MIYSKIRKTLRSDQWLIPINILGGGGHKAIILRLRIYYRSRFTRSKIHEKWLVTNTTTGRKGARTITNRSRDFFFFFFGKFLGNEKTPEI